MKKVHPSGNKSTEMKLIEYFSSNHITGWRRKYKVKGHPDFVFLDRKIAIFVDGCFWHGHEGCKDFVIPKSNTAFWLEKIGKNKERDARDETALTSAGWKVITIWECELKKTVIEETISALFKTLAESRS